jgi:hypothetical protein
LREIGECSSSRELKDKIESLSPVDVAKAWDLRPVKFVWNEKTPMNGNPDIGLIAEEVAEVYPVLASRNTAGKVTGVKFRHMVAIPIAMAQALREEIRALRARVEKLEAK